MRNPLREKCQNRVFSHPYCPIYGQNRILISPYLDRFSDDVKIRENTNKNLSIYCTGKYGSKKASISAYFTHYFPVPIFCTDLTWKHNSFRDIEKLHQPPTITPLQLGIIIENIGR